MKKWIVLLFVLLLAACTDEQPTGEPTRVQLETINTLDTIEIFEKEQVEYVVGELQQVDWQPNTKPEMARMEDVELRLFIEHDPNMPEYIITYRMWIENDKSLTILSTDEREGYGRLEANKAEKLIAFLYERIAELQPVIDQHGNIENRTGFERYLTSVENHKPDMVMVISYTTEGNPIYKRIDYNGINFKLEVDNREDKFGHPELQNYSCEYLQYVHNGESTVYKLTICDGVEGDLKIIEMPFDSEKQQFTKDYLPEMTIMIGKKAIPIYKGAFSWTMPTTKRAESMSIETDHASPNQMLQLANAVNVEKSSAVNIQFEVDPTRVEYRVWDQEKLLGMYDTIEGIDISEPFILEVFAYFGDSYATYVTALQFQ